MKSGEPTRRGPLLTCGILTLAVISGSTAIAQERLIAAPPGRVVAARPVCVRPEPPTLGTFEPTPYVMVRGDWPVGGGYSPNELYGDQTLAIYGPTSPFRAVAAPVMTYTRGYDGRVYARPATSFSTPNLPALSPLAYPTQSSYYYGPRINRTPPKWDTGFNWIDQN